MGAAHEWGCGHLPELIVHIFPIPFGTCTRHPHPAAMRWLGDVVDLVLARGCVSCDIWGAPLCNQCLAMAERSAGRYGSTSYGTSYRGIGKAAVLAHKRQLVRALADPLGRLLANAIRLLVPQPTSISLVCIPPHRAAVQVRGQDTVHAVASAATHHLQHLGYQIAVPRLLIRPTERPSLAGASRVERQTLVRGAFACIGSARSPVVVVDDVITTGATVGEAMRMLQGNDLYGAAAIAAVRRKRI